MSKHERRDHDQSQVTGSTAFAERADSALNDYGV